MHIDGPPSNIIAMQGSIDAYSLPPLLALSSNPSDSVGKDIQSICPTNPYTSPPEL
jgi:hypothetical protein